MLFSAVLLSGLESPKMFGPIELELPVTTSGNPYDPEVNDVRAIFKSATGKTVERLAFFRNGKWIVKALVPEKGKYLVMAMHNGDQVGKVQSASVSQQAPPMIRTKGKWFVKDDGTEFWPVGINTAWGSESKAVAQYFPEMAKSGFNWSRVWSCHWDNRNPYWSAYPPYPKDGEFSEAALERWDKVIAAAEKYNLKIQFVFFHHGQVSSLVNPNWPDHPWNAKNGGFLKSADQFFTDEEAKRRTKMFLRTAAARWGSSSAIMAWELFNEVQFTDMARVKGDWKTIGSWHNEMADYIRSVDSYRHLITTSSELEAPIWNKMDYLQGHAYPPRVASLLLSQKNDGPKPMFFGEVGPSDFDGFVANDAAVRDGIWGGFFALHSGAGQYWTWDKMDPAKFAAMAGASAIIRSLPPVSTFSKLKLLVVSPIGSDLDFTPGRGWEKTTKTKFSLPAEGGSANSGLVSGFLQGTSHREMQDGPLVFKFKAAKPGKFSLMMTDASDNGGNLKISVNGESLFDQPVSKEYAKKGVNQKVCVDFPAGDCELVVENTGLDWIMVNSYHFTGIAPQVRVEGVRSGKTMAFWATGVKGGKAQVSVPGVGSGKAVMTAYPLDSAKPISSKTINLGKPIQLELTKTEEIIVIKY